MLSNVDIIRELGKNLYIHPLTQTTIKGASINLTASNMAWSVKSKISIVGDEGITISAHDTGLIETNEIVFISEKLAGTYHSRVKTVSVGTGHIGTTMNPSWIGRSLIAIHNHTDEPIRIKVGEQFVTLTLYYLNTKSTVPEDNQPGRSDILQGYPLTEAEKDRIYEDPVALKRDKLKEAMCASAEYKEIKRETNTRDKKIVIGMLIIAVLFISAIAFLPAEWERWHRILDPMFGVYIGICFAEILSIINRYLHR